MTNVTFYQLPFNQLFQFRFRGCDEAGDGTRLKMRPFPEQTAALLNWDTVKQARGNVLRET